MKKMYHKFLIVSTIVIFFGGVYIYFSNDMKKESLVPVAYGSSSLTSSDTGSVDTVSSSGSSIDSDIAFLTTLVSLKKIKIDTSLFSNNFFNVLQDNTVKIDTIEPGRVNPFSPISNVTSTLNNSGSTSSSVTTDVPTQITATTAVLNGTINTTNTITDIYFNYGNTESLGTLTSMVKQSLVGTFIKTVSGLTPKTTYFFKACANVNSKALCGEVVSFTTN